MIKELERFKKIFFSNKMSLFVFVLVTASHVFPAVSSSVTSPMLFDPRCLPVTVGGPCSTERVRTHGTALPNLYGHHTVAEALEHLRPVLENVTSPFKGETVVQFLCTLYLPPCPDDRQSQAGAAEMVRLVPLPCRGLCEMARDEVESRAGTGNTLGGWPTNLRCHVFPTERCYALEGVGHVKFVKKSFVASGTGARMHDVMPKSVASLESELGDDDPFDVQVVTLSTNHIPPRRYDLTDLGNPTYFQGWADVQGTGAANDYCRVLGKGKRIFLSCALAGTSGQDHTYVSKLGFDPGHSNTWFMRDVDSDGRDDYCRCLGTGSQSHVVCMKAGDKSFYGSTLQGGTEYTFELPGSQGCHNKRFNPHFGL